MAAITHRFYYLSRLVTHFTLLFLLLAGCSANNKSQDAAVNDISDNAVFRQFLQENGYRQDEILEQLTQLVLMNKQLTADINTLHGQMALRQIQFVDINKELDQLSRRINLFSKQRVTPGPQQTLEQIILGIDALKSSLGKLESEQEALYHKLYTNPSKLFYLCRMPQCGDKDDESSIDFSSDKYKNR